MDKEVNIKVKSYFNRTAKNSWKCSICENEKIILGNVSNCKDHLIFVHAEIAQALTLQKRSRNSLNVINELQPMPLVKKIKYNMDINQVR